MFNRNHKEKVIESMFFLVSALTVIVLLLMCYFIFSDSLLLFKNISILDFLTGKFWYPTSIHQQFGLLPLFLGSLLVTAGSIIFSVPLGIACAVYISEISHPKVADFLKPFIEILAGIPSVVFGFFGLVVLVPYIQNTFNLPTGQTALTGSIMVGLVALPTIITLSEDAISSIPSVIKEGSLALGATRWQTMYKVIIPASFSGISAAVMLGLGRAIGETMTLMMVTGNAAIIPSFPGGFLHSVRTMTATIALEMGEVSQGSTQFHALFAVGSVLFIMTLLINLIADYIKTRYRFKVE